MANLRKQPFIYITWLKNYLIGDDLCRWSIWHRIYHHYEEAASDFDSVRYKMEHARFRNEIQQRYIDNGFEVLPELDIKISGNIALLKGRIDLVAIKDGTYLIIEAKTGAPRPTDKIQLMLYIWALPKCYPKFRGVSFDGLLIYKSYELEISAMEVDEVFVNNFTHFMKDILGGEPDRKYPSLRECNWCKIGNCDERLQHEEPDSTNYTPNFF